MIRIFYQRKTLRRLIVWEMDPDGGVIPNKSVRSGWGFDL